jgi:hypothetical protein
MVVEFTGLNCGESWEQVEYICMLHSAMKWMYATSTHHHISVLTVGKHHDLLKTREISSKNSFKPQWSLSRGKEKKV